MVNVGFIGCGNMGCAIIKGILSSSVGADIKLFAYDKYKTALDNVVSLGVNGLNSASDVVSSCKYVFFAIKPQQLDEVLDEVADKVTSDTVIVSILAGVSDEYYAKTTVSNAKVVLVMPNTPFLLGEGATALSRSDSVTDDEFDLVCRIFSSGGISKVIPKDKMKEIIAINGSSPAFIYLYTKYFVDYAKSVGIDEKTALDLFAKSLIGSAKMMTDSGKSIDELIEMVSSKGGTTIAGLEKLREGGISNSVENCCKACTKRAYELSK